MSVNKLNKNSNVNGQQAELVFNDNDEMVERAPERILDDDEEDPTVDSINEPAPTRDRAYIMKLHF